ncbi:MAG: LacI family DNA-binding transcriptional regulator [Acidobacteriota bacterium]|nr:LacI family DNA-binding transcriptional regulator [Acidobacteriota bacterium]
MPTRMKDIAEDLGVSLMTVSKALRNHSDVAEETRRRVNQRARELGYEPNLIARSLAGHRSFLIGLVVPDLMHSFFAEVAKGIENKVSPLGYQIVICSSGENTEIELREIKLLLARKVDGLIIASAAPRASHSMVELLEGRNAHYVLIDREVLHMKGNYVGVKDDKMGFLATEHLIEQGCARIAHLRGPLVSTGKGRLHGYQRALGKHGLKVPSAYVIGGGYQGGTGYSAMQHLLQLKPRPDGVFCYNDPVASGAIRAILEAGLDIPRDIAVVGAGDVHYSDMLRVPLSTINQSSFQIGESSAEILLACIESKTPLPPKRIFFPPRLVVRESSLRRKAPPAR